MSQSKTKESDQKLLETYYSTGDQKWLGILMERYTLLLLGVGLKYLKDLDEAKDAVQQAFLKTLDSAPQTQIKDIGAWLYQVTKNECLTKLRKNKLIQSTDEIHGFNFPNEPEFSIQDWIQKENKFKALKSAIHELKKEQEECITLFYLKEMSYKEISKKTSFTLKEIKSHIQNGKRNLKNKLSEEFKEIDQEGGTHATRK